MQDCQIKDTINFHIDAIEGEDSSSDEDSRHDIYMRILGLKERNRHFEVQKRFTERPFSSSAEDINRLRSCIEEKVRGATTVSPDHYSVRVDSHLKDFYTFYIAHINFTSCEAGVCGAMQLDGKLNSFRPEAEEEAREVLSSQIRSECSFVTWPQLDCSAQICTSSRANVTIPNRRVFNILEEEIKALLRYYKPKGVEGKTAIQKNGSGSVELSADLDASEKMQRCLGKIGKLTQGKQFRNCPPQIPHLPLTSGLVVRAPYVRNLIIPANWSAIAAPIAKEFSVEMCVSGTVIEPTVKVFGRPEKVQEAVCTLAE